MKRYALTSAVVGDLFDIWAHIAIDNIQKADEVESDIYAACERLSERPDVGHWRRDLTDRPVRFFTVRRNYLIVYDPETTPLQVVRILHGARDVALELESGF